MLMARGCTKATQQQPIPSSPAFLSLREASYLFFFAFGIALLFPLYFILGYNVLWLFVRSRTYLK